MKNSSNNGDAAGLPSGGGSGWHDEGQRAGRSPLNETLQHVIGSQLKAAYDEVVRQPVPDRFLELLAKLDGKQTPDAEPEEGSRA
ncbi:NepR family anti-sigma factor [Chelatococcus reniformis]|uniref:Anti-sigma factor NepR domain-containing protein n=1 Tax=Chelatococcus reniformis TaxID=1494448 RepID=A0A916U9K9_9HYPH|nr:NepR family anti-sigma factor [Chelatococcus reniformis]GGC63100.1 hypothetical protein GCM10010994_22130 [Chelatococcus reniformis]